MTDILNLLLEIELRKKKKRTNRELYFVKLVLLFVKISISYLKLLILCVNLIWILIFRRSDSDYAGGGGDLGKFQNHMRQMTLNS